MDDNLFIFLLMPAWEPFRDLIPENERGSFVHAYHKRLNSDDIETQVSVCVDSSAQVFLVSSPAFSLYVILDVKAKFHILV